MTKRAAMQGEGWFARFLLPGFALKAVIIGGGYATGRELAEFFLPAGPVGGLTAMLAATLVWSIVAALTFAFAQAMQAFDYRSFFSQLLGPLGIVFEIAFLLFVVLILAVFGAAAGAIGAVTLGWPEWAGSLALAAAILGVTASGSDSVERLFRYASFLIYAVYAAFIVLALTRFGDRIGTALATSPPPQAGWLEGGVSYAAYNIVGAVMILPVLRHLTSRRDALVAGAIAGPLTMLPAILFFIAMAAFYPAIGNEVLPSDFLLRQMGVPAFALLFQLMIFLALVESGVGAVHAINERIAHSLQSHGRPAPALWGRSLIGASILAGCMFVASHIGLVDLIASGYRFFAVVFLAVFVLPLLTIGVWRMVRHDEPPALQPATDGTAP
jgi:uncharacterized membrane protein YkvI